MKEQSNSSEHREGSGVGDLDGLEKVARAASQGEWKAIRDRRRMCPWRVESADGHAYIADIPQPTRDAYAIFEANARHIATFDPPTVLALIAENRRLIERLRALEGGEIQGVSLSSASLPSDLTVRTEAQSPAGEDPRERAQTYLDGWEGKNELRVGPHMLAWALKDLLDHTHNAAREADASTLVSEAAKECEPCPMAECPDCPRAPPLRFNMQGRHMTHCQSDDDGHCTWTHCPQLRDNEPATSHRHCPLDMIGDEE